MGTQHASSGRFCCRPEQSLGDTAGLQPLRFERELVAEAIGKWDWPCAASSNGQRRIGPLWFAALHLPVTTVSVHRSVRKAQIQTRDNACSNRKCDTYIHHQLLPVIGQSGRVGEDPRRSWCHRQCRRYRAFIAQIAL